MGSPPPQTQILSSVSEGGGRGATEVLPPPIDSPTYFSYFFLSEFFAFKNDRIIFL